jgi:hypothetical protein
MRQGANVNQFVIEGKNGTLLQLNGGGVTFTSLTVNGIFGDIDVDLYEGNDQFSFLGSSSLSNVPNNLTIYNDDGSNVNVIDHVQVNGNLEVRKKDDTTGYSELHIDNSIVIGFTVVDNTGGANLTGGETLTSIDNSWLQGNGGPGPAFDLDNGNEKDITDVLGNSQFGIGPFPFATPVVDIDNRDGGSRTTFTGASPVAGFGTTTVYGDLSIDNGLNVPLTLDVVTFNSMNVLGDVEIDHGEGNTMTVVVDAVLGSSLVATPFSPVIGSPFIVEADAGYDETSVTGSKIPWGCKFEYDVANYGNSDWGSKTVLSQSECGTHPFGPNIPTLPGVGLKVIGDYGRDLFDMSVSKVGGTLDLTLYAGNNEVNIKNQSVVGALKVTTLGGNDKVLIDDSIILVAIDATLDYGADSFLVTNVQPAEWPSALLGSVNIDGGYGVDTTNLNTGVLPINQLTNFELFV